MPTSQLSSPQQSLPLTFGVGGGRVKMSATRTHSVPDLKVPEAGSFTTWLGFLKSLSRRGLSWKMCQGSSQPTKAPLLSRLSSDLKTSGIWGDGFRLTLGTRVYPKTGIDYSLSELLDQTVLTSSFLTAANCLGILRRANRNGHRIDPKFATALGQTLRLWYNVAAASGTQWLRACAPRYVPRLENIKAVIQTGPYYAARNLSWDECEKLMGFPPGWTVVEGDSLAIPSAQSSPSGSLEEY